MSEIKSHGSEYLQETTTTKANPLLQDLQSPQAEILQANFFRTPTISGRSSDLFTNENYNPKPQIFASKTFHNRSSSYAPSATLLTDMQPSEEVRSLLSDLKQKYRIQKPENLPSKLVLTKEDPLNAQNPTPTVLTDRNTSHTTSPNTYRANEYISNHAQSFEYSSSMVRIYGSMIQSEVQENTKPLIQITSPGSIFAATSQKKFDFGLSHTRTHSHMVGDIFKNQASSQRASRSSNAFNTIYLSKELKESVHATVAEQLKPDDCSDNTAHLIRPSGGHKVNIQVAAESEIKDPGAIQLAGKDNTLRLVNTVQNFFGRKEGSLRSQKPVYDRKKIDGIIKGILERRSSPHVSSTQNNEERCNIVENNEINKKPTIFSNSNSLRATPSGKYSLERNIEQKSHNERKIVQVPTDGNRLRPPNLSSDQKPRTIFSNLESGTPSNPPQFFRRPSTPRTQTMARRPIIGTLTNRKSSYGVSQPSLEGEIDSPLKLYGLQLPNRTSPKFGELESSERRVHQGNNEPVYHCCELENDEDSVILNLINNNQNFADKYKNEFNNDVLENQKGEEVNKAPASYDEVDHTSFEIKGQLNYESGYDSNTPTPRRQNSSRTGRQSNKVSKKSLEVIESEDSPNKQQSPNFTTQAQVLMSFSDEIESESKTNLRAIITENYETENDIRKKTLHSQSSIESNPQEENKGNTYFQHGRVKESVRVYGFKPNSAKRISNKIFETKNPSLNQDELIPSEMTNQTDN